MIVIEDLNIGETDAMLRRLAARTKKRIDLAAERFGKRLQKALVAKTPVYTGAAKGTIVKHLPPSHPARYYDSIDLGWKTKFEGNKKEGFSITLSNAMWDHYLKYVEYGMQAHGPNKNAYFVRATLAQFLSSEKFFKEGE